MINVEKLIEDWSSSLSERLIEIRFVDIDEMKSAMKAHLKSALVDCLKIQLPDIEKKLIDAKRRHASNIGSRTSHIQDEIIALKAQTKERWKLLETLEKSERIKQQNKWMMERHPESFKEFCKFFEENFEFRMSKP